MQSNQVCACTYVLVLETCFWCFKRNQCYRSSALNCSNRTATEEKEGDDLADQLDLDEGMDTHATPCKKQPSFPVPAYTLCHTLSSLLLQFTHHSSVSHPRISQWLFEPIHPPCHPLHPSVQTFLYAVTYPTSHIVYYSKHVPFDLLYITTNFPWASACVCVCVYVHLTLL